MNVTHGRSRYPRRQDRLAGPVIEASLAIRDGAIFAVGAAEAMPAARETIRRRWPAHAARRDRRSRPFPRSRLSHKEDWATGTAGGRVRRRHDGLRHAEHASRPTATPRRWPRSTPSQRAKAYVDYRPLRLARRGHDRQRSGADRRRRHRLQALHGQHFRANLPSPPTGAMLEAFEVVAPTRASASRSTPKPTRSCPGAKRGCATPAASTRSRISRRGPAVVAVEAVGRAASSPNGPARAFTFCTSPRRTNCGRCAEAKARGVDITGETCPQYLLLVDRGLRPRRRRHPGQPARARAAQPGAAVGGVADGTIDMIATDHAPHTPEEKTRNDIWTVDCGFPGVETQMPLMLTEVARGRGSISRLRALERGEPGQALGALSAQRRDAAGRRRGPRDGRSRAQRSRSTTRPFNARENLALARSKGQPACRSTLWCAAVS